MLEQTTFLLLATCYPYPNSERDYIRRIAVISMSGREMVRSLLRTRLPALHTVQSSHTQSTILLSFIAFERPIV